MFNRSVYVYHKPPYQRMIDKTNSIARYLEHVVSVPNKWIAIGPSINKSVTPPKRV